MDFQNIRTEVTTTTKTIQNGVDDFTSKMSDGEDEVIQTFDSLGDIRDGDSDNDDENIRVRKTVTYTYKTNDIFDDINVNPEVHDLTNNIEQTLSSDGDLDKVDHINESVVTTVVSHVDADLEDSEVDNFFGVPEVDHEIITNDDDQMRPPVDAELSVNTGYHNNDNRINHISEDNNFGISDALNSPLADSDGFIQNGEHALGAVRSDMTEDSWRMGETGGSEVLDDFNRVRDDVEEFSNIQDDPVDDSSISADINIKPTSENINDDMKHEITDEDNSATVETPEGGVLGTIKEKVMDVRSAGLNYAGDAITNKLEGSSDEGIMGTIKDKAKETNAVETVKNKITDASDSAIKDDSIVNMVKDKIGNSDFLGSFGASLTGGSSEGEEKSETLDGIADSPDVISNNTNLADDTTLKTVDNSDFIESERVADTNAEPPTIQVKSEAPTIQVNSEPPTIQINSEPAGNEIDTFNALSDDDMDYEMKEVDISINNEEDFGKVFAENRQSMRESQGTELFRQPSRFNSNESLDKKDKEKKAKKEKEANETNYTISDMPKDEARSQRTCAGIMKSFFCPKRGSWQPDSYL
ncbi:hypothetical protein SNE40_021367 [Patella caerulea]|uniref:Uncharacterized protein n=1 Tax=Patella caerulea TaxID=87958 RepID=A0AAN8FZD1_PATCE